jgi:hypothetical protein
MPIWRYGKILNPMRLMPVVNQVAIDIVLA